MKTWSDSPFDRTVSLSLVDHYSDDDVIARDNGESFVIFEPPRFEGWLVKRYKPETKIDDRVLGRLIEFPETMPSADLALIDRSIAWPVARVVEGNRTVGTIMAKAKKKFFWDIELLGGRTKRQIVEIDHLASTEDSLRKLGFPVPSTLERLKAMRNVIACAALFEKYDIVYADWSFANAFWSPRTHDTLIIDVDASGIGQRRFVETPNWEDPLMGRGHPVTTHTDRYKVALLVTRAVTGQRRDIQAALAEMENLCPSHTRLIGLLRRALGAQKIELRPTLAELQQAIENPGRQSTMMSPQPDGPNVTVLRPWRPSVARPKPSLSPSAVPVSPYPGPRPTPSAPPLRPRPAPSPHLGPTPNAGQPISGWVAPPWHTAPIAAPGSPATSGTSITPSVFLSCLFGTILIAGLIIGVYLMITFFF